MDIHVTGSDSFDIMYLLALHIRIDCKRLCVVVFAYVCILSFILNDSVVQAVLTL